MPDTPASAATGSAATATDLPLTRRDVEAAHGRIRSHIRRTPVMEIAGADVGHDTPVSLKLELYQHAGSFKARGAFNNLLSRDIPAVGVTAASGGNHGIAVSHAASKLGHTAHIFVPTLSTQAKMDRIKAAGGTLHVAGKKYVEALTACQAHQAQTGAAEVQAYQSPETIAGQGTLALEWTGQSPDLDTVLIAVGGGGLISGVATGFDGRVKVVGVEPQGAPTLHAALAAGEPVDVKVNSIAADSLGATSVGPLNAEICKAKVDHVALVTDAAIVDALRFLWQHLQLATEPGGATTLAALMSGAYRPAPGEKVGILICGGNVDLAMLGEMIAED